VGIQLVTAATELAVSLDEVKAQCRVTDTASDALFETYIAAATEMVEQFIGRSIMAQTWLLALDRFSHEIDLPRGPATSVQWVKYIDPMGNEQAADSDLYALDLISDPQRLVLVAGASWPATQSIVNSVKIQFVSGYAVAPAAIKMALLATVNRWFDNREIAGLAMDAKAMLRSFRRPQI
jgi:uncharacterized phiE125 gp8 family phage protein